MWKNVQLEAKTYSTLENSDWEKHQENGTCRKAFIWRSELINSLQGHVGEKTYKGTTMETFSKKTQFIIQKKTHTGKKPYEIMNLGKHSIIYKTS